MTPQRRIVPTAHVQGKISRSFFERGVRPNLGLRRRDVLVGPRTGVDVGVVRLPTGGALLATTDPLYIEPRLGWERAAWFAFHILASDLTTTGHAPDWATIDLDVPPDTSDRTLRTILRVFGREARRLGATIITGHTGRYPSCAFPIVGSGTLLAAVARGDYVTTSSIPSGAVLLASRTAALEATGMLATFFPGRIKDRLGADVLRRARSLTGQMTTVPDALRATRVGLHGEGVWAMHDATEGGLRAAAWEMAFASGRGLDVELSQAWVDPVVDRVTREFEVDPLDASSEGTLLIAADPGRVDDITSTLEDGGATVSRLGLFTSRRGVVRDGRSPLRPAVQDSYWAAVRRASRGATRRRK